MGSGLIAAQRFKSPFVSVRLKLPLPEDAQPGTKQPEIELYVVAQEPGAIKKLFTSKLVDTSLALKQSLMLFVGKRSWITVMRTDGTGIWDQGRRGMAPMLSRQYWMHNTELLQQVFEGIMKAVADSGQPQNMFHGIMGVLTTIAARLEFDDMVTRDQLFWILGAIGEGAKLTTRMSRGEYVNPTSEASEFREQTLATLMEVRQFWAGKVREYAKLPRDTETRNVIINLLKESNMPETLSDDQVEEIVDQIMGLMIGNFDNTGYDCLKATHDILAFPEEWREAFAEVQAGIEVNEQTLRDPSQYPNLKECVARSTKQYTGAAGIPKTNIEPITIDGYDFPAGTNFVCNMVRAVGADCDVTLELVMAEPFPDATAAVESIFNSAKFGDGATRCPGRNAAMLQVFYIAIAVLKHLYGKVEVTNLVHTIGAITVLMYDVTPIEN